MDRLTHWNETSKQNVVNCDRGDVMINELNYATGAAIDKLSDYEDTGLTPEEVGDLLCTRELTPEAEYAIDQHFDALIEHMEAVVRQAEHDAHITDLLRAESEGRLIVLPCKVGSTVCTINEQYFDCENCQHKEEAHYQPHIDKVACENEDRRCPLSIVERIVEGFEISKSKNGDVQISDPGQWGYEGLETFSGFDGHFYFTREEAEAALKEAHNGE